MVFLSCQIWPSNPPLCWHILSCVLGSFWRKSVITAPPLWRSRPLPALLNAWYLFRIHTNDGTISMSVFSLFSLFPAWSMAARLVLPRRLIYNGSFRRVRSWFDARYVYEVCWSMLFLDFDFDWWCSPVLVRCCWCSWCRLMMLFVLWLATFFLCRRLIVFFYVLDAVGSDVTGVFLRWLILMLCFFICCCFCLLCIGDSEGG